MPYRPDSSDYESLLHEDEESHKMQQRRKRGRICILLVTVLLMFSALIVGLYFVGQATKTDASDTAHRYKHAAVASDVAQCSTIGRTILKAGGNAVDSAIATLLCMGVADTQSMGIGGGFFMTIYNRTSGIAVAVDARETAPSLANETMFEGNPNSSHEGPLSIAVPGEVRGYWETHKLYGRLPWKDLFLPTIEMTESGFKVPKSLADAFNASSVSIFNEPSLHQAYVNPATGKVYREGELLKLPQLAATLRAIADEGEAAYYNGSLTASILADLKDIGSIITREDLLFYKPLITKATEITLDNGVRVFSPPPPSSGVLLSFMLNVLDGYNFTGADMSTTEGAIRTLHRVIETFKFAYAKRTDLADENFANITDLVANLTSRAYADSIRAQITDNSTHNVSYYGPTFYDRFTTGTAHLSIIDAEGNAVSVTSTINARFGSKQRGKRTGILFNDEMDDFSSPNITNIFGIPPSPANFIQPGKRPLSSMCPAVFVSPSGDVRLVVGAAGGSRITTATAFVAASELWLGDSMDTAVSSLRLHHQLLPDYIEYEVGFDQKVVSGLEKLGHKVQPVQLGQSIVQAVAQLSGYLYATSDFRKGGIPDGY